MEQSVPQTKFERLGYKKAGYRPAGAPQKLGARGRKARAKRSWRKVRMVGLLLGSVNKDRKVHPHLVYAEKYANPSKVEVKAATRIQATWRGKMAREEQFWELMYGDDF